MKKIILSFIAVVIIILGSWYFYDYKRTQQAQAPVTTQPTLIASVNYICNEGKTIQAYFYQGPEVQVQPGEMPIPSGSAKVILSDGRTFDLNQTISADGGRYANSDESFVFWSKGNGALVLENNVEKSYIGCILEAADPGGLPNVFTDGTIGFSIRYPDDYSVNSDYQYQELGPGKEISGVKFTIPESMATGTNLSDDSGVSVEFIPDIQDCNASLFLPGSTTAQIVSETGENSGDFSFATSSEAAAGNRYEESVAAIPGSNPCIGFRTFIHYTVFENYPEGTVTEFDRTSLLDQFDKIGDTLITL